MPLVLSESLDAQTLCLTLNRPDKLNALVPALLTELIDALRAVNHSREIRAVVITGAGRGFCAGADLAPGEDAGEVPGSEGMSQLGYVYKYQELLAELMLAIHECDKPVIAAVNGAAVGGGLGIALACDLRVASEAATFGAVFIKTGLSSCDVGTSYFLPRLVPPTIALELMASGRIFPASEAQSLGMLNRLVAPDTLLDAALELAQTLNANAEYGVWMTKKGFWQNLDAPSLRRAMELENRTQVLGYFSGCMEEAMAAFAEGRKPQWKPL
ncbi:MAG: enoyl-CoA hydratase-related protein [Pseudomonadota bacterium]